MLKTVVRALCLTLGATTLVVGMAAAPAFSGDLPKPVDEAADTLKCKNREPYEADKPVKFALQCFIKGQGLGYEGLGRTSMLLFKTKAAGKAFWTERLAGCGECYIVRKDKLWIASASGYEQDVAAYVLEKLGGKLFHF